MRILRPEQRIYTIGNPGLRIEDAASVAADWWKVPGKTCVAAYQAKGATSYAASKVNLASPGTYDATEGVAPTWDTGVGWTFDGIAQYLSSQFVPSGSEHITAAVRLLWTAESTRSVLGARSPAWFTIQPVWGWQTPAWYYGEQVVAGSQTDGNDGVYIITKDAGYRNGVLNKVINATGYPPAAAIWIGAYNYAPAPRYWCGSIQALSIYRATLAADEIVALTARMTAL